MHNSRPTAPLQCRLPASARFFFGAIAAAALFLRVSDTRAAPLSFQRAIEIALARAPLLTAQRAAVDAAQVSTTAAAELPNPRLIAGIENLPVNTEDRFSLTRDFMTMRRLGWMQEIPNRDKRAARSDVAGARVERERVALAAAQLVVKREAALAWLARHYARARLDALDLLVRENRLLLDTIEARIAAGKALPLDSLTARQETAALADRRDELARELAQAQAMLVRWVGDAASAPPAGDAPSLEPDSERLRAAIEHQPELANYAPLLRISAAEMREADAARKGDWSWEVSYAQRGPAYSNMMSVMFSFEVPLANQRRVEPLVTAKRREIERLEAEREDTRRRRREELERQLAAHDELTRKLDRLRSVTQPLVAERVQLATASYGAGRADLATVLSARRDYADARVRALELEAQRAALRAQLAYLVTEEAR